MSRERAAWRQGFAMDALQIFIDIRLVARQQRQITRAQQILCGIFDILRHVRRGDQLLGFGLEEDEREEALRARVVLGFRFSSSMRFTFRAKRSAFCCGRRRIKAPSAT